MMRSIWLAMFLLAAFLACSSSRAGILLSVNLAPPELPVYVQPAAPAPGYMWTPGYWAYGDDGYFWVPGTWIMAPFSGALWTPGYWGWNNGTYLWNGGYWGLHVGYYGGVNYGFGYGGTGYYGGRWQGGVFQYNQAVTRVNTTIVRNTYNETVVNHATTRVSFNGGPGGIRAVPSAAERSQMSVHHVPPVSAQIHHVEAATSNRTLLASVNHGKPAMGATVRPVGPAMGRGKAAGNSAVSSNRPSPSSYHSTETGSAHTRSAGGSPSYEAPPSTGAGVTHGSNASVQTKMPPPPSSAAHQSVNTLKPAIAAPHPATAHRPGEPPH